MTSKGGNAERTASVATWLPALAVLLSFLLAPSSAGAEADGPDFYAVRPGIGDLVLRAEPEPGGSVLGHVPAGTGELPNLGCEGGPSFAEWLEMSPSEREAAAERRWCRIRYEGIEGWVRGTGLMEDSGPARAE